MLHALKNTVNCSTSILRHTNLQNHGLSECTKINLRFFGGCNGKKKDPKKQEKAIDPKLEKHLQNYEPTAECTVKCDENMYSRMIAEAKNEKGETKETKDDTEINHELITSQWLSTIPRRCIVKIYCPPPVPVRQRVKREMSEKCTPALTINKLCPKICLPGCAPVPLQCQNKRKPWDCVPIEAPYPSYSECRKPKAKVLRKSECTCLDNFSLCDEILRELELKSRNVDPDKCAFLREKKELKLKKC